MKRLSIILVLIFQYFFSSSQGSGEIIRFESANPFSFNDIIDNLENQKSQDVFGKLIFPEDSAHLNKKYPLIIGVAGSLGWADHHFEYMKMYRDMGIATFELNSFQSRDVTSTVGTQVEVTTASMILDAYIEPLRNYLNTLELIVIEYQLQVGVLEEGLLCFLHGYR